jgi:hypothetical protein
LAEQNAASPFANHQSVVIVLGTDAKIDGTRCNPLAPEYARRGSGSAQGHHFAACAAKSHSEVKVKVLARPHGQSGLFACVARREVQSGFTVHGEVLLAASHESNRAYVVQASGLAPQAQVAWSLFEADRALRRIAHVDPNWAEGCVVEVVARRRSRETMGWQIRDRHCEFHLAIVSDCRPIIGPAHGSQESFTTEVMMAAGSWPYAQEHGPAAAVIKSDKVSMAGGLDGMPSPAAMAKYGIVRAGDKRPEW